jgi:hypothetical protein
VTKVTIPPPHLMRYRNPLSFPTPHTANSLCPISPLLCIPIVAYYRFRCTCGPRLRTSLPWPALLCAPWPYCPSRPPVAGKSNIFARRVSTMIQSSPWNRLQGFPTSLASVYLVLRKAPPPSPMSSPSWPLLLLLLHHSIAPSIRAQGLSYSTLPSPSMACEWLSIHCIGSCAAPPHSYLSSRPTFRS